MNMGELTFDEANLSHLAQTFEDSRQQRATGDRRDDVIGIGPSQLLDDLKSHRLGAFGVEAAQVDVCKPPAVSIRDLRAQPIHIVVVAFDGHDVWPIDGGAENLRWLEIVRDEDVTRQTETRRVRGHASSKVAGRCAGEDREIELDRLAGRDRYHAVLIREGRMVD